LLFLYDSVPTVIFFCVWQCTNFQWSHFSLFIFLWPPFPSLQMCIRYWNQICGAFGHQEGESLLYR
jgi:hypothetical protein